VNESKSARYHRLQRQAGVVSLLVSVLWLLALLIVRPGLPLWWLVVLMVAGNTLLTLPIVYFRGVLLERRYELSSETTRGWAADQVKAFALSVIFAVGAIDFVYAAIRWNPVWWWIPAAIGASLFTIVLARLAPVLLLPIFYKFTPLERPELRERLLALSERAGVRVLGVYEWALGTRTRRANAALTGAGSTRRILLSDTLLADYTDDEIEVILAHELAHHVHRDIPKGLALELVLITAAFLAASVILPEAAAALGLADAADPRGVPALVLIVSGVSLVATPLLHSMSRRNEYRADRFALRLTRRTDAFVSAMRRLGAQNLAEENPSRLALWLFHSHPPIDARIAAAHAFSSNVSP
jgi:STE24 endopeptidase